MKNWWTLISFLLITGLMPVCAQNSTEQLVVPLTDPGKPGNLKIGLVNGSIRVVGSSGKDVVIEATSGAARTGEKPKAKPGDNPNDNLNENLNEHLNSRRRDDPSLSAGMRRISTGNPFELSAEEKNNQIEVRSNSFQTPVNLSVRVPQRFSLRLSTVNRGDITVENVTGELEITSVNGSITLTSIGGSAVASTVNGNLVATFREVGSNTPMAFSTLNGRVDVTLPSSAKATVKMKSDRGDIFSDFDIELDRSQPKASRSSQSGMYRVAIEDWVYGKINGGGPEVMMKSMQGNIYVRKAK